MWESSLFYHLWMFCALHFLRVTSTCYMLWSRLLPLQTSNLTTLTPRHGGPIEVFLVSRAVVTRCVPTYFLHYATCSPRLYDSRTEATCGSNWRSHLLRSPDSRPSVRHKTDLWSRRSQAVCRGDTSSTSIDRCFCFISSYINGMKVNHYSLSSMNHSSPLPIINHVFTIINHYFHHHIHHYSPLFTINHHVVFSLLIFNKQPGAPSCQDRSARDQHLQLLAPVHPIIRWVKWRKRTQKK